MKAVVSKLPDLTTHEKSTFIDEGVIHYCVPNIPSVVARTATYAFINAACPYIHQIAKRHRKGNSQGKAIKKGVITYKGDLRHGEARHLLIRVSRENSYGYQQNVSNRY